jgi:hypothetical protein
MFPHAPCLANKRNAVMRVLWREMQDHGGLWLTSADRFLLEIAATLIAWHRDGNHKVTPLLIGVLGKLGFSPKERAALTQ